MEDEFLENVIGFDALYKSMMKCRKGVSYKDSVAYYCLNGIKETIRLERELKNGKYEPGPQRMVHITHPKPREAVAISFRDRVYQRSLNDNIIYPAMSRSFIYDNAACQKGKGTDFARDRLDEFLHQYYRKYGINGYVLQTDIKGYYQNMSHEVAEQCFRRYLPDEIYQRTETILRNQYEGEVGYNPGSQMVQIAGISVLSPLDHYIKEQLRVKFYQRYMDDAWHIHPDLDFLGYCLRKERSFIANYGFQFHPDKTKIYKLKKGIHVLGFTHRLTDTGKVIRILDPKNVKNERKKLYRMAQKVKSGEMTREKVDQCYESWKAHASKGNSFKLLQ
ncbi:MAG: hypothetical protein LIO96_11150, partial [Lachnospiraceae bacterium]|nr:hypothetical protein [Lachnospiraceae bacterium]